MTAASTTKLSPELKGRIPELDGFRWAITGHGQPPGPILLASSAAVDLVLLGGLFFFNRTETTVGDRV
jgi:hypothetical protein